MFVGDYYTVLKRGGAFIEVLLEKLRLQKPYTEEDKIRMQKVKEERDKFLAEKKALDEQKARVLQWTQQDRKEFKEKAEMQKEG